MELKASYVTEEKFPVVKIYGDIPKEKLLNGVINPMRAYSYSENHISFLADSRQEAEQILQTFQEKASQTLEEKVEVKFEDNS